jgi:hypothetical protein
VIARTGQSCGGVGGSSGTATSGSVVGGAAVVGVVSPEAIGVAVVVVSGAACGNDESAANVVPALLAVVVGAVESRPGLVVVVSS